MSIGDVLAEARCQADLTISEVSQVTCIRETIIRGIERDDYSACGGDFYARGHVRSIARAVGTDPESLITEFDLIHGAPSAITAADAFEPSAPIKLREPRGPNWSAVMALALALIVGFAVYQAWPSTGVSRVAQQAAAARRSGRLPRGQTAGKVTGSSPGIHRSPAAARDVVIHLNAIEDCWVQLTTASGRTIFSGIVYGGTREHWTERQAVSLVLGNPSGIALTVNGKNLGAPDHSGGPVTLSLGPGRPAAS